MPDETNSLAPKELQKVENWSNKLLKSREILMFVCRQKDVKQYCDATKVDRTHYWVDDSDADQSTLDPSSP